MPELERLIYGQLALRWIVEIPPLARRRNAWMGGRGPAPDRKIGLSGRAARNVLAHGVLTGEVEVADINDDGPVVGTARSRSASRAERRHVTPRLADRGPALPAASTSGQIGGPSHGA
ncbi:MAG: hypothetical protein K1X38_17870 [Microthrixaceae bacterium]|nr:hypothetical protein [Microthrixaceae bacterium]